MHLISEIENSEMKVHFRLNKRQNREEFRRKSALTRF